MNEWMDGWMDSFLLVLSRHPYISVFLALTPGRSVHATVHVTGRVKHCLKERQPF